MVEEETGHHTLLKLFSKGAQHPMDISIL